MAGTNNAYEESGIESEDIDMVECHDTFIICELL